MLIDAWATWCGPCLANLPVIREIHSEFANNDQLVVLGINLDGDPEKAKEHILRAIEITQGKYLMAKFLLAKFHAVPVQDKGAFKSILEEILAAPVELFPEQTLANNLAKRNAERWLKRIDEIFF